MVLRPYSIRCPEFSVTSGGIRVLYGLYGWLLAKGQVAFLNAKYEDPNFVGIYTDIHRGNELGASTVVRYLLNVPGVMGATNPVTGEWESGQTEFDESDKLYYFSRLFGGDDTNTMFLPILNTHLFKDQHKNRNKSAVFFGKGTDRGLHKPSTVIDRNVASNQQELADFLNECYCLYTYDPVSAQTEIARLCGTRVVYLGSYTKEDYGLYEPGTNGMSFGSDTGEKLDVEVFRDTYMGLKEDFSRKLDFFIEETQK